MTSYPYQERDTGSWIHHPQCAEEEGVFYRCPEGHIFTGPSNVCPEPFINHPIRPIRCALFASRHNECTCELIAEGVLA